MLRKLLFLTYLMLVVFVLLFAQPENFTLRATCECYYKFENAGNMGIDTQGQVGSGDPVALTNNGVTQSADYPDGTYGSTAVKSGDFESGDPDWMFTAHANAAAIDNLTNMTIVVWYKAESEVGNNYIFCMGDLGSGQGWLLRMFDTTDLQFYFDEGQELTEVPGFSTGKWYFFAATYTAADGERIYWGDEENQVVLLGSALINPGLTAGTALDVNMGRHRGGSGSVDGQMTEIAAFSESLSLSDLEDIQQYGMEGGRGGEPENAIFFGFNFMVLLVLVCIRRRKR